LQRVRFGLQRLASTQGWRRAVPWVEPHASPAVLRHRLGNARPARTELGTAAGGEDIEERGDRGRPIGGASTIGRTGRNGCPLLIDGNVAARRFEPRRCDGAALAHGAQASAIPVE
jgi:hypothetical protein